MRSPMIRRLLGLAIALVACATEHKKPDTAEQKRTAMTGKKQSPLLAPWQGPWGGAPPFGKFKVAEIKTAMEEGMAQNLAEIDEVAANPDPPTFESTIVAMERAGQPLTGANP